MVLDFAKEAYEKKDQLKEKLTEVIKLSLEKGIIGQGELITIEDQEYFISFSFHKTKKVCKECGRDL